jgi:hypothetical protein
MPTHRIETRDPCSAARKLIAEGAARGDGLEMLRDGQPAMVGRVGWFADRRVEETATISPRFVKWRPFPGLRGPSETASNDRGVG